MSPQLSLLFNQIAIKVFLFLLIISKVFSESQIKEEYLYNDFETRIKKQNGDLITYYISDNFEVTFSNTVYLDATKYIHANDQKIVIINSKKTKYQYPDQLGSASRVADEFGTLAKSICYSPFGSDADAFGDATVKYKYTGQEEDQTGLYYYGARYYDTVYGRFLAADSILTWSRFG